jgi:curved DNA-binding protein CbpA
MVDYYAVLGVAPGRGIDHIRKAYLALAKALHPDTPPGEKLVYGIPPAVTIEMVNYAYGELKDPRRRSSYDIARAMLVDGCAACKGTGLTPEYRGFIIKGVVVCRVCGGNGITPGGKNALSLQ